jgi:outer membrane protein OmpA-like peptidoglycan-associated protein
MTRNAWQIVLAVVVVVVAPLVGYAQQDRQGCEDHPLLTRMDGFYIEGCKDERFSSYRFNTQEGRVPVEGHYRSISYRLREGQPDLSGIEMIRNYLNAVQAIGGKVMYEGRYSGSTQVVVDGREVWIEVAPHGKRAYRLDIVEKQAMEQQVVADAAALLADLDRAGHVVLDGILFDTDKAVIKPESQPALSEIAKLLKENAGMKAFIVGHTDMSGSFEHNLDLSERRAAAVIEALVNDYGISADRVTARGVGPLAPIGSNGSEKGRALNRRVEMVNR